MTTESGKPKRRGRPPAPEEKKRRHNLTFRIRSDLKEEIERKSSLNGRSISEEMEYIIEKALPLFDENANSFISDIRPLLGIHVKDKFNSVSPEIYQASISQRSLVGKDESGMTPEDILALHETVRKNSQSKVTIFNEKTNNSNTRKDYSINKSPHRGALKFPLLWVEDPAEREGALHMARAFLHAARKGTIEALDEMLGSEIVAAALAEVVLAEAAKVNQSTCSNTNQPKPADQVASLIIEGFREIVEEVRRPADKRPSSSVEDTQEGDHSLPALVALVGRLTAQSTDLNVLWSSSWPHRFADLPAETRTALFELFGDEAASLYEIMMRPELPRSSIKPAIRPDPRDIGRGMRMDALRRMQERLLPLADVDDARKGQDKDPVRGRG